MNRACGSCARTAVVSWDEDYLCACLCNAACDSSYTCFGYELNGDPCLAVSILKVVDELCEVLDRIDIVMRRRWDKSNTGCWISSFSDPGIDFLSGKVSAFTGLGTLGHFDLDLFCTVQVFACNTESSWCDLLDLGVLLCTESLGWLTALTCIGLAAQTVHCDSHALVSFLGDRTVRHSAGLESLYDLWSRLYFLDRYWIACLLERKESS